MFTNSYRSALLILSASILVSLGSKTVHADFYTHPLDRFRSDHRTLDLTLISGYYGSSGNFEPSQASASAQTLNRYHRFTNDLIAQYGIYSWWTIFARFNYAFSSFTQLSAAPGRAYNLGDQSFGSTFRVLDALSGATLDLQIQADVPFYNNGKAASSGAPFIGDGSVDFTGSVFFSFPLDSPRTRRWNIEAGLGYTFRTAGFSMAIPYFAGVAYENPTRGFFFRLRGNGFQSLGTDSLGESSPTLSNSSGGSYFVNAVNPSVVGAELRTGYRINPMWSLFVSGSYALFGLNAPQGFLVQAGLQFRLSPKVRAQGVGDLSPSDYAKDNQGFVTYTFDAYVVKVNDALNLIKINKGADHGVQVGQVMDVFAVGDDGSIGESIARAKVIRIKGSESALKITEYFREVWVEEGFLVRMPLIPQNQQ